MKTKLLSVFGIIALLAIYACSNHQNQDAVSKTVVNDGVQLGTVVSSVLNFQQFCAELGEVPSNDPRLNTWAPCDGKVIIHSNLADLYPDQSMNQTPDLRGRFIRGLNVMSGGAEDADYSRISGDPELGRRVKSYQSDLIKHHTHDAWGVLPDGVASSNGTFDVEDGHNKKNADVYPKDGNTVPEHRVKVTIDDIDKPNSLGAETRPRNIALYYYIKINRRLAAKK